MNYYGAKAEVIKIIRNNAKLLPDTKSFFSEVYYQSERFGFDSAGVDRLIRRHKPLKPIYDLIKEQEEAK